MLPLLSFPKEIIKRVLSINGTGQNYKMYYISKSIRVYLKQSSLSHMAQGEALNIINRVDSKITFDSPMAIGFTRLWKSMKREEQEQFRTWIKRGMDYTVTYLPIPLNHLGVTRAGIWNEDWRLCTPVLTHRATLHDRNFGDGRRRVLRGRLV